MAEITREQVVDYLSNLPVIQIADLIKTLEEKWGVKAAPVASVLPSNAMATFPAASLSPMMPEPITAASRRAVPRNSPARRRGVSIIVILADCR